MGRFHGSIVPKGVCDTLSWGGKRRWDGGAAVCRAYYKMDEVGFRAMTPRAWGIRVLGCAGHTARWTR
jgi:hypothetical protein